MGHASLLWAHLGKLLPCAWKFSLLEASWV